jgi:hypothetical protein
LRLLEGQRDLEHAVGEHIRQDAGLDATLGSKRKD